MKKINIYSIVYMAKISIKPIGTDKQKLFIKKLIIECVCKVHEEFGEELEDDKNSSHLIQSIMNFIETYVLTSKFSKDKFDKKKILYVILNELYKGEYETEIDVIEKAVRHIVDNNLIKVTTQNIFLKAAKAAIKLAEEFLK